MHGQQNIKTPNAYTEKPFHCTPTARREQAVSCWRFTSSGKLHRVAW